MVKNISNFVNTALNKYPLFLEYAIDQPTCKKALTKLKEVHNLLTNEKINFKVFNISLKLLQAFLIYRLLVQGGANMNKHQSGVHCNPPFQVKCRTSSFSSPSTRRTVAVDHYFKLMGQYFIARRNIPYYTEL